MSDSPADGVPTWQTETEYYDIHADRIFSEYPFFLQSIIGNTPEEFLRYLLGKLRLTSKSRLLDLGCGSGYLVGQVSGGICRAMGISTSMACIEGCRTRYPHARFEQANMETFVMPGATHVTAMESLGYGDLEKTLLCATKSLVPGGIFYVRDVLQLSVEDPELRANREYLEYYWKWKALRADELISLFYQAGFELLEYKNQTSLINTSILAECMSRHSAVPYIPPYPKRGAAASGEFVFKKWPHSSEQPNPV